MHFATMLRSCKGFTPTFHVSRHFLERKAISSIGLYFRFCNIVGKCFKSCSKRFGFGCPSKAARHTVKSSRLTTCSKMFLLFNIVCKVVQWTKPFLNRHVGKGSVLVDERSQHTVPLVRKNRKMA